MVQSGTAVYTPPHRTFVPNRPWAWTVSVTRPPASRFATRAACIELIPAFPSALASPGTKSTPLRPTVHSRRASPAPSSSASSRSGSTRYACSSAWLATARPFAPGRGSLFTSTATRPSHAATSSSASIAPAPRGPCRPAVCARPRQGLRRAPSPRPARPGRAASLAPGRRRARGSPRVRVASGKLCSLNSSV